MSETENIYRKRLSITEEQNNLLKSEAEARNVTDAVLLKEIINLGFESYFAKDEDSDSGHTEEPKYDEKTLQEILKYSKKAAELSFGMLAAFYYTETDKFLCNEAVAGQIVNFYNGAFTRSRFAAGSDSRSMTLLFEKVGEYLIENGGDLMNAYWRFCNEFKVDPRMMFNIDINDWAKFKTPMKNRPLKEGNLPAYRIQPKLKGR